jgi:hypothetical protein
MHLTPQLPVGMSQNNAKIAVGRLLVGLADMPSSMMQLGAGLGGAGDAGARFVSRLLSW